MDVDVLQRDTQIERLLPLNPQTTTGTSLSLNQPLLQGAGAAANLAPILISRIDTERSFFQLKDAVQETVRGTIEAYWQLSFAQVDVWAREQQVAQGRETLDRADARVQTGDANEADAAQARVSYETFRANLIAAQANRLNREAALRNIIGIPPTDGRVIVPSTSPSTRRLTTDWLQILSLAEEYRPNLVELKLVMEADEQRLVIAQNGALPRLDGVALYRWNGLEGRTPAGTRLSDDGEFTDWELGVNFSVPLGLRRERAQVRQTELVLTRDRANLDQALHEAAHTLAASYRNLDHYYEQYLAFARVRDAARTNVEQQLARQRLGFQGVLLLDVLTAITTWGNAVLNWRTWSAKPAPSSNLTACAFGKSASAPWGRWVGIFPPSVIRVQCRLVQMSTCHRSHRRTHTVCQKRCRCPTLAPRKFRLRPSANEAAPASAGQR
jgi:outer membrane protein TolC